MADPITLTIVFGIVTVIGVLVATLLGTLQWRETRKQTRLAERTAHADNAPAIDTDTKHVETNSPFWRCGIYDYAPLSVWPSNSDEEPTGPLVELARRISASLGKTPIYEVFSYESFYKGGTHLPDMVVGLFETKRRAEHMVFSRPIYKIGLQGLCRKAEKRDILLGLREGDLRAAVYYGEVGWEYAEDELADADKEHRIAKLMSGRQLDTMDHLTQGEYTVVIMDSLACHMFLSEKNHAKTYRLAFDEPLDKFDTCVAVLPEHRHLMPKIDDEIITIRNSDSFLAIEQVALVGLEGVVERRALRARV